MSSLLDSVSEQIGTAQIQAIAQQLGASPEQTERAIHMALPTILGALAKRVENEDGAAHVHAAVSEHSGGILDSITGMLGNAGKDGSLGGSLLGSILGGRQSRVEQGIGKAAGLDAIKIGSLLAMLAPIVMGVLAKQARGSNMDPGGLAGMLRKERQSMEQKATGGLLSGLLDQDGDGDFDFQDVLRLGMKKILGR